jgi:hypothetical protein
MDIGGFYGDAHGGYFNWELGVVVEKNTLYNPRAF